MPYYFLFYPVFNYVNRCAIFDLCSDDTVTLSLFDSQAVALHMQLESMRDDPKVIVATSINPKLVGGSEVFLCICYYMFCMN